MKSPGLRSRELLQLWFTDGNPLDCAVRHVTCYDGAGALYDACMRGSVPTLRPEAYSEGSELRGDCELIRATLTAAGFDVSPRPREMAAAL